MGAVGGYDGGMAKNTPMDKGGAHRTQSGAARDTDSRAKAQQQQQRGQQTPADKAAQQNRRDQQQQRSGKDRDPNKARDQYDERDPHSGESEERRPMM